MSDILFNAYIFVYEKNIKRMNNYENIKKKISYIKKIESFDSINEKNNCIKINSIFNFNCENIINDKLKGKFGCNLSQQILWLNHLKSDKKWLLILEDDTNININNIIEFNNILNKIINFADNNNSHFIQLETREHHIPDQLKQDKTIIPNLYKMKPQCGMSAYLINKKAIKYLFSFLPWDKYIDVYTSDINNINKLNSLCYVNNIFKTLGAQRQIDKNSKLGSIIYNYI